MRYRLKGGPMCHLEHECFRVELAGGGILLLNGRRFADLFESVPEGPEGESKTLHPHLAEVEIADLRLQVRLLTLQRDRARDDRERLEREKVWSTAASQPPSADR